MYGTLAGASAVKNILDVPSSMLMLSCLILIVRYARILASKVSLVAQRGLFSSLLGAMYDMVFSANLATLVQLVSASSMIKFEVLTLVGLLVP